LIFKEESNASVPSSNHKNKEILPDWDESQKIKRMQKGEEEDQETYSAKFLEYSAAMCNFSFLSDIESNFANYCGDHATNNSGKRAAVSTMPSSPTSHHSTVEEPAVVSVSSEVKPMPVSVSPEDAPDDEMLSDVASMTSSTWSKSDKNMYLLAMARRAQQSAKSREEPLPEELPKDVALIDNDEDDDSEDENDEIVENFEESNDATVLPNDHYTFAERFVPISPFEEDPSHVPTLLVKPEPRVGASTDNSSVDGKETLSNIDVECDKLNAHSQEDNPTEEEANEKNSLSIDNKASDEGEASKDVTVVAAAVDVTAVAGVKHVEELSSSQATLLEPVQEVSQKASSDTNIIVPPSVIAASSQTRSRSIASSSGSVSTTASNRSLSRRLRLNLRKKKWQEVNSDDEIEDDHKDGRPAEQPVETTLDVASTVPDNKKDDHEVDKFVSDLEYNNSQTLANNHETKSDTGTVAKLENSKQKGIKFSFSVLGLSPSDESGNKKVYFADDCSLATYHTSQTNQSNMSQWSATGRDRYLKAMELNENTKNTTWIDSMQNAAVKNGYSWDPQRGWIDLPIAEKKLAKVNEDTEESNDIVDLDEEMDHQSKDDQSVESQSHLSPSIKAMIRMQRKKKNTRNKGLKVTFAPEPIEVETVKCSESDERLLFNNDDVHSIEGDGETSAEDEISYDDTIKTSTPSSRSIALQQYERHRKAKSSLKDYESQLTDEEQIDGEEYGQVDDPEGESLDMVVSRTNNLIMRLEGKSPSENRVVKSHALKEQQHAGSPVCTDPLVDLTYILSNSSEGQISQDLSSPSSTNATRASSTKHFSYEEEVIDESSPISTTDRRVSEVSTDITSLSSTNATRASLSVPSKIKESSTVDSSTVQRDNNTRSMQKSLQGSTKKSCSSSFSRSANTRHSKPRSVTKSRRAAGNLEERQEVRTIEENPSFDASTVSTKFTSHSKAKVISIEFDEMKNTRRPPQPSTQSIETRRSPLNKFEEESAEPKAAPQSIFERLNCTAPTLPNCQASPNSSFMSDDINKNNDSLPLAHLNFMKNASPKAHDRLNGWVSTMTGRCSPHSMGPIQEEASCDMTSCEEGDHLPEGSKGRGGIHQQASDDSLSTGVGGSKASTSSYQPVKGMVGNGHSSAPISRHSSTNSTPTSWQLIVARRAADNMANEKKGRAKQRAEANAAAKVEEMMATRTLSTTRDEAMVDKRAAQRKKFQELIEKKRYSQKNDENLKKDEKSAALAVEEMMNNINLN